MPPSLPLRSFARDVLSTPPSQPVPSTTTLTQKFHDFATRTLFPRLATDVNTVPEGYGRTPSGPDPGAVVGIVLGSIAGFLLLLCIVYWCVQLGNPTVGATLEEGSVVGGNGSSSVVSYRSRPRVHRHRHSRSSRTYSSPHRRTKETIEVLRRDRSARGSPSPLPRHDPDQIIVLEEHNRSRSTARSRSRSRSVSRPRPPPPPSSGGDEIVVMEEHTPPRRRDSRSYRRESRERRSSGGHYRDVDPYMSRRRSTSRR
ncbi:hypothetical protein F4819DRAFT_485906 [Hypoxylon fuscum]|nr:hypothetical protein F4819DRAFT_485906 [Hypoxylon fuscum]